MSDTTHRKANPPRGRILALTEREQETFARSHPRSRELYERAGESLFGGVPMSWMMKWAGGFPVFADHADGSTVVDVDDYEYADYCLGDTGAMTGHAPPAVAATTAHQAARAITTMMPSSDAPEVGEALAARFGLPLWQVTLSATDANRFAIRMSFAEMVVPYRDPSPEHYRRTAFDVGEWGLGYMTTSLELGCDCLGEIRYLDAVLSDAEGEPYTIKNTICIHEEDDAVLWKHVDDIAGAEVRRSRRLVISFHATVANYEYLVYWRFYQDGNIGCEVRATGIMVTTSFAGGEQPPYGALVDERTYAPYHQHLLVARLDLDIDGEGNTIYMSESEALPVGPDNPYGLALVQRNVPLRTEEEGKQDYDWQTQRSWKVFNDNARNGLGTPTAYKLVPGGCFPAMLDPSSPVLERAGVIGHTLWVTPYGGDERWPCGEFVNQSEEDTGLTRWTQQNRSIENTDVVLWYVFGLHHITRPEEWPVMPVDTVSFWLKPAGFFDRNPALDVPPNHRCHDPVGRTS